MTDNNLLSGHYQLQKTLEAEGEGIMLEAINCYFNFAVKVNNKYEKVFTLNLQDDYIILEDKNQTAIGKFGYEQIEELIIKARDTFFPNNNKKPEQKPKAVPNPSPLVPNDQSSAVRDSAQNGKERDSSKKKIESIKSQIPDDSSNGSDSKQPEQPKDTNIDKKKVVEKQALTSSKVIILSAAIAFAASTLTFGLLISFYAQAAAALLSIGVTVFGALGIGGAETAIAATTITVGAASVAAAATVGVTSLTAGAAACLTHREKIGEGVKNFQDKVKSSFTIPTLC